MKRTNNLAILECGLQLSSGWDEDVFCYFKGSPRQAFMASWHEKSPTIPLLVSLVHVDDSRHGQPWFMLLCFFFFFTSFPFSLVRQAKLFKASPITQFCFKGPSHKIMYDRIRHLPLKALPPCHVQLDLTRLRRASLTAWAPTEAKVQVRNRSSRSREAEYSEASVDCGRSPRRNHWGRGRTSQCGQIFKAECKFPSLHSSK